MDAEHECLAHIRAALGSSHVPKVGPGSDVRQAPPDMVSQPSASLAHCAACGACEAHADLIRSLCHKATATISGCANITPSAPKGIPKMTTAMSPRARLRCLVVAQVSRFHKGSALRRSGRYGYFGRIRVANCRGRISECDEDFPSSATAEGLVWPILPT